MTNRKAPYSHSDGSNCWTKDCSRRGGDKVADKGNNKVVAHITKEELLEEFHSGGKARNQDSFSRLQEQIEAREKTIVELSESMRLHKKQKLEDISAHKQIEAREKTIVELSESMRLHKKHGMEDIITRIAKEQYLEDYYDKDYEYEDYEYEEEEEDRKAGYASKQELVEEGGVKSFDLGRGGASELSDSLLEAQRTGFEMIPPSSRWKQKYQHMVVDNLQKIADPNSADVFHVRHNELAAKVGECMSILDDIREYSSEPKSMLAEYNLGRRIKSFNQSVADAFNRPLTLNEQRTVFSRRRHEVRPNSMVVNLKEHNPVFRPAFASGETKQLAASSSSPMQGVGNYENHGVWISSKFPELSPDYSKTEELLKTANGMKQSIEDEYFVEQVSANYYPSIYNSLETVSIKEASPQHREMVVGEAKAQLAIIQGGLQKIIDNSISRSLQETKAQTLFLRTKMGGNVPELELPVRLPNGPVRPSNSSPKG